MTDRELMQMALDNLKWINDEQAIISYEAVTALRQAIAEAENIGHAMLGEGKPFYRSGKKISLSAMRPSDKFILVRTGQVYSIKDNGSIWNETENRPSRLHKNCQVEPLYPAHVHASDISQERVDETAKREHEPWQSVQCTCGGIIYFKHTKREWVGLTDEEIIKCFDSVAFGQVEDDLIINKHVNIFRAIHFIEAKLKEKNT